MKVLDWLFKPPQIRIAVNFFNVLVIEWWRSELEWSRNCVADGFLFLWNRNPAPKEFEMKWLSAMDARTFSPRYR